MGEETKIPPLPKGYKPVVEESLPPLPEGFSLEGEVKKKIGSEGAVGEQSLPQSSQSSSVSKGSESVSTSQTEILQPVGGLQYSDPNRPSTPFVKPPIPKVKGILTDREMKEFTPEEQKKFTSTLPDLILANKALLIDSPNAEANRKKFYEGQAQGDLKAGDIEAIGEQYAQNIKDIAVNTEKIKANPEDYDSKFAMSENLSAIGHNKAANVILESMMEQKPDFIPSYQQSALLKARQENYSAAIGTLDVGIQNNPDAAILYSNRAALKAKTGDTQGAVQDLDAGISKTENPHALELMYTQRAQIFKGLAADKTTAQKYIEVIQNIADPEAEVIDQEYFNERYQEDLAIAAKLAVRNAGPEKYQWYSAEKKSENIPDVNTGTITTEVSESVQMPSDEAQIAALNKKYKEIINPSPGIENYVVGFLEDTNESVVGGLEKTKEAFTREGEALKNALEGKITPTDLAVESTKAFVQGLSGLTSSALGVAMHVTPVGLGFTAGTKIAEQSEQTQDLIEFLMAPVSAIWQPETEDGQNLASLFDVVIGGMLIHGVSKGIKGATEVAEKIKNKEPITKEDVPIIVEAATEVIKNPEAKAEIEKQFGLKPKSPEQITAELKVESEKLSAQEKPQEVVAKEEIKVTETATEEISAIEKKIEPEVKDEKVLFEEAKKQVDTSTKYTDIADLKEGDFVAVKSDNGTIYEGFATKIGLKNISVKSSSMYGIGETKFKKQNVQAYYKPKSEVITKLNPNSKILSEAHPKEEIDFANELIDDGWFKSSGNLMEASPDLGLPTKGIEQGIADIKAGKNSAPAKQLIEALKKVRDTGEMPMIKGTGGLVERSGINITEARKANVEIPKEINEVQKVEAEKLKLDEIVEAEGITKDNFDSFVKENDWIYTPEEVQRIKKHVYGEEIKTGDNVTSPAVESKGIERREPTKAQESGATEPAQRKPEEVKAEKIAKARAKTGDAIGRIVTKLGGKKNLTPEEKTSLIKDFQDAVEGIAEELGIRAEEAWKELKERIGASYHSFMEENKGEILKETPEAQLSGIKKSLVPEEKIPQVEIEKRSATEMLDRGKEIVDSGEVDPVALTSEIANGKAKALQPNEVSALVYYKAKLDNSLSAAYKEASEAATKLDTEAQFSAQAKVANLEKQLNDYHVMSVKTAYEQSLAFRLRKMLLDSEYNLQTQIAKYKAENNGVIPAEVEAKFREYAKELNEAQEKLKEAEERLKKTEDELTLRNIKEANEREIKDVRRDQKIKEASRRLSAKIREGKIHRPNVFSSASPASLVWDGAIEIIARTVDASGSIAQATANAWAHIKESDWYKAADEATKKAAKDGLDEYITELEKDVDAIGGKIKIPKKLIRDFVERGIDNIEELTTAVKDAIKDRYPEATEREVRDAITGYGKTINLSKDEINTQIRKMKRIGKLVSGIEDAQKKQRPLRSGLQRDRLSKEEIEMQRELKGLLKDLPFEEADMEFKQKSGLDSMKTRIKGRIAELEKKIADKDFSSKPIKKPIRLDDEVIRAKAELEKVKEKFDLEQEKNKLQQQSLTKKIWDISKDFALGITKTLQASADMSAPFRQGLINSARPSRAKLTAQEFKTMFQHAFSESKSENWLHYIKSTPEYPLMKQAGLFLSEPNAKLSAREEIYKSNLAQRIPGIGHILKASERAYSGFLNMQRVNEFMKVAEKFKRDGIDPTTKEGAEVYKAWANYVNNATGRGSMGSFEMAANSLSDVFFSPRLIAARFNVLNPAFYAKMPKAARLEALKSTAEFIGVGLTAISLAKLAGADVETDPRSADFGKIKIGNTRLDIWGGFIQWVRMFAQLATGERKSTSTGKITELGKGYGSDTRFDILVNFFKNKLAPTPALAVRMGESHLEKIDGEEKRVSAFGEEIDYTDEAIGQALPLYVQDFNELAKEHDPSTLAGLMMASFFGFGVQQQKPQKDASKNDGIK